MSAPMLQVLVLHAGLIAATNDEDWELVNPFPGTWKVLADQCYFCPATDSPEDNANYATLSVDDGTTTIAEWSTQDTGEGTLTAGTPAQLVDQNSGNAVEIKQGERIRLRKVETGTGVVTDGTFVIPIEKVRPA